MNLAIRDMGSGKTTRLTTDADGEQGVYADYSRLSPDGRSIAFTWFIGAFGATPRAELQLIGADGSGRRTLMSVGGAGVDSGDVVYPRSWTTDGTTLLAQVYGKNGGPRQEVTLVNVRDGTSQVLRSFDWRGPEGVAISPDGAWLACDFETARNSATRDLYVISTRGGRESRITTDGRPKMVVSWSADGAGILFVTAREDGEAATIWHVPVVGGHAVGAPRVLRSDIFGLSGALGVTPTGLYYYVSDYRQVISTVTIDPDRGEAVAPPSRVAAGGLLSQSTVWSPDGSHVAFTRESFSARGRGILVLRNLATLEDREIPLPMGAQVEQWLPDGKSIQVVGRLRGQQGHHLVDLATGTMRFVGPYVRDEPTRSADGRTQYVIRNANGPADSGKVIAKDLTSGSEREIWQGRNVQRMRLAPDGKTLAMRVGRFGIESAELLVVPTAGGAARVLYSGKGIGPGSVDWSPDGRHVVFKSSSPDGEGEDLMLATFATGAVKKLLSDKGGVYQSHFSPDGHRILYASTRGGTTRELWVIENLPGSRARAASGSR